MLLPDDRWPKDRLRGTERFCLLSLGDWMKAAERAGVPAVPATEVAVFERDDVLKHEYAGPHQARMDAAYERIAAAAKPGTMLRWDCCSSGSLKATLSEGDTPDARTLASLPIDARILDAAYEFPRVLLPVWQRPWLSDEMLRHDGYPVEYRALVEGSELRGISSYYIQRPLRRDDAEIAAIEDATAKLITVVAPPFEWPTTRDEQLRARAMVERLDKGRGIDGEPRGPDPDGCHFTADFCVLTDGRVLLLEGGPPWFMGADPCCFRGARIEGLALEPRPREKPPTRARVAEATEAARGRDLDARHDRAQQVRRLRTQAGAGGAG